MQRTPPSEAEHSRSPTKRQSRARERDPELGRHQRHSPRSRSPVTRHDSRRRHDDDNSGRHDDVEERRSLDAPLPVADAKPDATPRVPQVLVHEVARPQSGYWASYVDRRRKPVAPGPRPRPDFHYPLEYEHYSEYSAHPAEAAHFENSAQHVESARRLEYAEAEHLKYAEYQYAPLEEAHYPRAPENAEWHELEVRRGPQSSAEYPVPAFMELQREPSPMRPRPGSRRWRNCSPFSVGSARSLDDCYDVQGPSGSHPRIERPSDLGTGSDASMSLVWPGPRRYLKRAARSAAGQGSPGPQASRHGYEPGPRYDHEILHSGYGAEPAHRDQAHCDHHRDHDPASGHHGHDLTSRLHGHDPASRHIGHDPASRHIGHDPASRHHGHDRASRHHGHDRSSRHHGHDSASRHHGHDPASRHHGHDPTSRHHGHDPASRHHGHDPASRHHGHDPASRHHGYELDPTHYGREPTRLHHGYAPESSPRDSVHAPRHRPPHHCACDPALHLRPGPDFELCHQDYMRPPAAQFVDVALNLSGEDVVLPPASPVSPLGCVLVRGGGQDGEYERRSLVLKPPCLGSSDKANLRRTLFGSQDDGTHLRQTLHRNHNHNQGEVDLREALSRKLDENVEPRDSQSSRPLDAVDLRWSLSRTFDEQATLEAADVEDQNEGLADFTESQEDLRQSLDLKKKGDLRNTLDKKRPPLSPMSVLPPPSPSSCSYPSSSSDDLRTKLERRRETQSAANSDTETELCPDDETLHDVASALRECLNDYSESMEGVPSSIEDGKIAPSRLLAKPVNFDFFPRRQRARDFFGEVSWENSAKPESSHDIPCSTCVGYDSQRSSKMFYLIEEFLNSIRNENYENEECIDDGVQITDQIKVLSENNNQLKQEDCVLKQEDCALKQEDCALKQEDCAVFDQITEETKALVFRENNNQLNQEHCAVDAQTTDQTKVSLPYRNKSHPKRGGFVVDLGVKRRLQNKRKRFLSVHQKKGKRIKHTPRPLCMAASVQAPLNNTNNLPDIQGSVLVREECVSGPRKVKIEANDENNSDDEPLSSLARKIRAQRALQKEPVLL